MLDRKFILANLDAVRSNIERRNMRVDLDRFVDLDARRRDLEMRLQEANRRANELAKITGDMDPDVKAERIAEARGLRDERSALKDELAAVEEELAEVELEIPNMTHEDSPIGASEADGKVIGHGRAERPSFAFAPRDHLELMEALDLVDFAAGGKVAGHGFYFLKNEAVLLDLALQRFAIDLLIGEGFTAVATPDLARESVLNATGFAPRGPETQIYRIEDSDLGLIATSEITLGGMYAGATLEVGELPILLCGLSHCFRTEAGAHGRATRGLYRVHQFTKVEMFIFCTPEDSEAMHQRLLDIEQRIFDALGVPYRVVDIATGDLGAAAYRKFDLEAWMPGRGEGGEWGEVTSTSNCTDFQARRLKTRYRDGKASGLVHSLNGTAVASGRAIIAIVENHQQADGSIVVPAALHPYLGMERIGPRR
ncbi:MAG: serine--tRNA ligase [Kiloniellales bacterium]|nr:serine--tRNA ligase [Kiloniellales bacterium]